MILGYRKRTAVLAAMLGAVALLAAMLAAAQVRAATTYPAGGSTFSGGAEGWVKSVEESCSLGILCTPTAGYDGGAGNPPGSLKLETSALIVLGGLMAGSVTFESPDFVATEGGSGTLSFDRALTSANLLDLMPNMSVTAELIDRTEGTSTTVISGGASGANVPFAGLSGAVAVVKGHTYAISMSLETNGQLDLGVLGSTTARIDNVALTVGSSGGSGGGSGSGGQGGAGGQGGPGGSGGMTNAQLLRLIRGSVGGGSTAIVRGNRVFINSRCPARIGSACRIVMQGHLNKRKAATNRRRVRLGKGKGRRVALTVKRFARTKVKQRGALLVKQTVRAGGAKVTVYKRLRLVRR